MSGDRMERLMRNSHNPDELKDIWIGWRTVSPPMRSKYERMVDLGNEGARALGYENLSTLWRSQYDMSADAFTTLLEAFERRFYPDAIQCFFSRGVYFRRFSSSSSSMFGSQLPKVSSKLFSALAPCSSKKPPFLFQS